MDPPLLSDAAVASAPALPGDDKPPLPVVPLPTMSKVVLDALAIYLEDRGQEYLDDVPLTEDVYPDSAYAAAVSAFIAPRTAQVAPATPAKDSGGARKDTINQKSGLREDLEYSGDDECRRLKDCR